MQRALWSALPTFFFPFFSCFLAPSQLTFGTPPAARRSPTSARVSRPLGMRHAVGRSRLTDEQTAMLWESFATNRLPNRTELSSLAVITRLPFKTVRIWFQNARQRHRAATCATDVGAPATRTGSTDVGAPLTMTAGAAERVLLATLLNDENPSWTPLHGSPSLRTRVSRAASRCTSTWPRASTPSSYAAPRAYSSPTRLCLRTTR